MDTDDMTKQEVPVISCDTCTLAITVKVDGFRVGSLGGLF